MEADGCPSRALGSARCARSPGRHWRRTAGDGSGGRLISGGDRRAARRRRRRRPGSSWISTARSTCTPFTLADPYRVVLDIPQVMFQLAAEGRRSRPRPDQGVSFRADDGGRLADRVRSRPSRCASTRPSSSTRRPALRRGWCSISSPPTATAFCARSRSTTNRRASEPPATPDASRSRCRRSAPARGARSRPWRHRYRHQGAERRMGKGHRARLRQALARADRESRANTAC